MQTEKDNAVTHPKHYSDHPSGIECIAITRHMNFNIGNAIKYLWRHGKKNPEATIEDLQKAAFYIQDEIERLRAVEKPTNRKQELMREIQQLLKNGDIFVSPQHSFMEEWRAFYIPVPKGLFKNH